MFLRSPCSMGPALPLCVAGSLEDVLPDFWKICPNSFYATKFLLHILCDCWYIIFSLLCARIHLKLDNLLLDIWFLITHLNRGMLDCARKFVRNQLFQYSLASASQLSRFPFTIQLLCSTRKPKLSCERPKAT